MKVTARKAKAYFREMKQRYGDKPTVLHLALFSGAADLLAMVRELREAGALVSS